VVRRLIETRALDEALAAKLGQAVAEFKDAFKKEEAGA